MATRELWINARDDVVDYIWLNVTDKYGQDLSAAAGFWVGFGTYNQPPEGTGNWTAINIAFDQKLFPSLGKARIGYLIGTDAKVTAGACHACTDGTFEMWMILGDAPTTTPFRCGKVIIHKTP